MNKKEKEENAAPVKTYLNLGVVYTMDYDRGEPAVSTDEPVGFEK